jgi:hypothetical protein
LMASYWPEPIFVGIWSPRAPVRLHGSRICPSPIQPWSAASKRQLVGLPPFRTNSGN